ADGARRGAVRRTRALRARGFPGRRRARELRLPRELCLLGRALERERLALGRDCLRDEVEVAGADFVLVARRRIAELLELELPLLQPHVRGHLLRRVTVRELEHRGVERGEAGERDEEERVAPFA